ncbi:MAG: PP2C family protein-serine/threonine phosphatase, partial [Wujia sp.]
TVIAALIEPDGFQWATVGDSHIYLYRGNQLLLLNREHIYEAELLQMAVNGRISFQSVKTDKSRSGLTSFIGMGELKYIDGSTKKLTYQTGDWLLLMSDGVFNTLSEAEICRIVQESACAEEAADRMEQAVLAKQNPKQDNFTAILLEL